MYYDIPLVVMVPSSDEWEILEWNEKPQTANKPFFLDINFHTFLEFLLRSLNYHIVCPYCPIGILLIYNFEYLVSKMALCFLSPKLSLYLMLFNFSNACYFLDKVVVHCQKHFRLSSVFSLIIIPPPLPCKQRVYLSHFVRLSVCQSVCLSVLLSVCLSVDMILFTHVLRNMSMDFSENLYIFTYWLDIFFYICRLFLFFLFFYNKK